MTRTFYCTVGALACALMATASNAQSFNIDFSSATGAAGPAPSSLYGAAAGQAGTWNNITVASAANVPLLDISNSPTLVTLSLTAGGFMFDASNAAPNGVITPAGSDDALFMDDVWDSPAAASISLGNLAAGAYQVYVYGGSPDSATTFMNFSIGAGPSQLVGGQWSNPFTYQQGITHALFDVTHAGGNLVINVPDVTGFESVNGLQVVVIPGPGNLCLLAVAAFGGVRRRRSA